MTAAPTSATPRHLRLLSCNIMAGSSVQRYSEYVTRSWTNVLPARAKQDNLDHLAGMLGGFDVIGLQEADAGSLRSGFRNQTQYLAEAAGMPFWSHQPNRPVARVAHSSNGLISRLQPTEVLDYPLPGRFGGRGVLLVRFGKGREALVVAIAHLSLGPSARHQQLGFIAELLADQPHVVLMGDLNTASDSAEMRQLFKRTALRPPEGQTLTFPSWQPKRAIDHILISAELSLQNVWTLPEAFSDHLPLAAKILLPPGVAEPDLP